MRVLIYIHSLEAGGAERVSANLANHWAEKGWEVTIVTVMPVATDFYKTDPRVRRIALQLGGSSRNWFVAARANFLRIHALRKVLKQVQPDVALGIITNANIVLTLASHGLPVCVIGSEHIYPPHHPVETIWDFLRRTLYGRMYAMAALTSECAQWIKENSSAKRVPIIPNAACWPLPLQQPLVDPSVFCKAGRKILLGVGRFTPQKDFATLIDVFARLAPAHPDWDLVILGDGFLRPELERKVRDTGLENRIHMPGVVGNIAAWYECADLYVMSSQYEGFPNTLAEAMAYGLPAVSFDCNTGPRDIIRDGIDGMLVRPNDVDGFADALGLLMANARLRQSYAQRAVEARERFSIQRISAMWEELFRQGIDMQRRGPHRRHGLDAAPQK